MLMKEQRDVSVQRGLPVEVVSDASKVVSVTGETVQLYYYNSGVLTQDAGQAAGVVVVGKLAYGGILNAIGDVIGSKNDTSLAYTSTALVTEKAFPYEIAETFDTNTGTNKAAAIVAGFANGEYCVDYRTGTIYAKKATTATSMTSVSYKVATAASSQSGSPAGTTTVTMPAASTGGYTPGKRVSTADTNAASIVAAACTVGYITASNVNAAARYLKIYNKASAPTVGTDVPVHTFIIPGNTAGAGTNIPLPPQGIALGTGFAIAITTEATDAGTTGVAASEIVINYGTK